MNQRDVTIAFNFPAAEDAVNYQPEDPLFKVVLCRNNSKEETQLLESDFELVSMETTEEQVQLEYELQKQGLGALTVQAVFKQDTSEVQCEMQIEAQGDLLVKQVVFPCLVRNNVNTYDHLLMSSAWGDNIPRPTKTIKDLSMSDSVKFEQDYILFKENEVIYTYPSILSMQYAVLHNESKSVYLASYGTEDETFTLNAKVLGKECLELSLNHYPFLSNNIWTSPVCSISILDGQWHKAADLYAHHMREKYPTPDLPSWMRESFHGWVEVMMAHEGHEPFFKYRDLPQVFSNIKETGINCINIAGWSGRGHDTLYPDYYYNPELGTLEEFQEALLAIKNMGGHPILYTNGRLVDTKSDYYLNGGSHSVCIQKDGSLYTERYNTSSTFAIACPSCSDYTSHMADVIERLILSYKAKAAMVDQISCNHDPFCYSKDHEHSKPSNNYLTGIDNELRAMRQIHKALDPEFFIWCEGCHERFSQFYDVNQGHGEEFTWQIGESLPGQFLYTYPDRLVTGHSYTIEQLYHSFVQGKPLDIKWNCFTTPGATDIIRELIELRSSYPEYFLMGTFRDSADIQVGKGIEAYSIRHVNSKGILVNLWKRGSGKGQKNIGYVRVPATFDTEKLLHPNDLHVSKEGCWIKLNWTGPIAMLLLEYK